MEKPRNIGYHLPALPIIDYLHTIDNICYLLAIPIEQIDTQINYRDINRPHRKSLDRNKMTAIRLIDIDDTEVWRIPNSELLRYCANHGWEVETQVIQKPKTTEKPKEQQ